MTTNNITQVLNDMKKNYQSQVIETIKNELISQYNHVKSVGIKSIRLEFEIDDYNDIYFDDNTGLVLTFQNEDDQKNVNKITQNITALVNMSYFLVDNIKLDVDDYIEIDDKGIVIQIISLKPEKIKTQKTKK